jgi:arylsulfatase A-like enzyme
MDANNAPLRGFKQQNYEGGIRTPFVVSWPARFKGGRTIATPISSLDLLPTALEAAGMPLPTDKPLDGESLLPLLTGKTQQHRDTFYWSEGGEAGGWAIRSGDWKLVAQRNQMKPELFNLRDDPAEQTNLVGQQREKVVELTRLYDTWLEQMAAPMSGAPKRWAGEPGAKKAKRKRAEESDTPKKKKKDVD